MVRLKDKKLFLLDMDGTIYLGDRLFSCTPGFLEAVVAIGARSIFLTNNSSKSAEDYVRKLNRLGIACDRHDLFTSVEASAAYINSEHPGAKVYAAGTRSMIRELEGFGIDVTEDPSDDVSVVLQGFDTEMTYKKVRDACGLIDRGAAFLACNIDRVCPVEDGYIPDCGSICEMITSATGKRARFLGKPQPEMISGLLRKLGIEPDQAVMVGDRLYTDIACGINAGVDTALVLSGETSEDELKASTVKPTYVFRDVGELAEMLR